MSGTEPAQTHTEGEDNQAERPYAILRIKRKRNEEPLDGLLVDREVARPKGKRSRAGLNFFKFAETVEQGAWDDEQTKKDLEARLAALARESRQEGEREPRQLAGLPSSKSAPADMGQSAPPATTTQPAATEVEAEAEAAAPPPTKRPRADETPRKYTILKREVPSTDPQVRRRMPVAPPKVWSMKELEAARAAQAGLAVYEAVPSTSGIEASDSVDAEVAKFLPLLQDYLKLEDPVASPSVTPTPLPVKEDDSDYVYDIFYQRLMRDPSASLGNVGTLTGVPDELIVYDSDDDNDSEVYDTADEDSNAEDWYQNDYPDEESDRSDGSEGSDIFHDGSDREDMIYDDDSDGHEWR
ncbi:uncharacterized protein C8Q71DRAFT_789558 [Rhodofomes roseus]|uniref:Probable RNA polymerase II nuclear localization protein SLC7A6OS n=1 Tax=Rhodofomes roseus TaxID=34475 RepID=A0ABQ8JZF3_9APHY|nr:uncharacterized protein C8Q71DRAFT_789558 [Rhodofomes roseus]KAH9829691.1 hypothetical protein C8Q71DRAFT_789558 [Rhodofomes roseus]